MMELYLHPRIRPYDAALNELSSGTTFPLFYLLQFTVGKEAYELL
jgi:hypothetical protein